MAGTQLAILATAAEQAEGNKQIKHDIRKAFRRLEMIFLYLSR